VAFRGALGVAVEVFADEGGAVAGVLEPCGHRRTLVTETVERWKAAVVAAVAENAMVVGVLAAQDRGARWTAERRGGERVGERHALGGKEGLHTGEASNRPGILIIGQDEDDIGWGGGFSWRPSSSSTGDGSGCGVAAIGVAVREPDREQDEERSQVRRVPVRPRASPEAPAGLAGGGA
jgi:hypothetical protein